MATMTVSEAYYVVYDVLVPALGAGRGGHFLKPASLLKGYDLVQICTAFNLLIAAEFLSLRLVANACAQVTGRDSFEEEFAKAMKVYVVPRAGLTLFVPDDQVDVVAFNCTLNFDDPRYLSLETPSSFADYCRSLGADDPMYWQKIYTRLRLEYTSTSPRGNEFVALTSKPYLRRLHMVRERRVRFAWAFGFAALVEILLIAGVEFPVAGWLALVGCIVVQSFALCEWRFGAKLSPAEASRLA